jgi:KipI family sensor histidine kinase inhibitor
VIRPFGESALLVEVEGPDRAQAIAAKIAARPIEGVVEVVPGLRSVLVEIEPGGSGVGLRDAIEARMATAGEHAPVGRERTVPVVYGGEHGPDLDAVAALCGLTPREVIEAHTGTGVRVLFGGFAPGFAYLGELPASLRVARLATPRVRTPAGSVAIADAMTGVYPAELPGGWRVIGRTPLAMFDPRRDPPAYLVAGDVVRFHEIDASEWEAHSVIAADW